MLPCRTIYQTNTFAVWEQWSICEKQPSIRKLLLMTKDEAPCRQESVSTQSGRGGIESNRKEQAMPESVLYSIAMATVNSKVCDGAGECVSACACTRSRVCWPRRGMDETAERILPGLNKVCKFRRCAGDVLHDKYKHTHGSNTRIASCRGRTRLDIVHEEWTFTGDMADSWVISAVAAAPRHSLSVQLQPPHPSPLARWINHRCCFILWNARHRFFRGSEDVMPCLRALSAELPFYCSKLTSHVSQGKRFRRRISPSSLTQGWLFATFFLLCKLLPKLQGTQNPHERRQQQHSRGSRDLFFFFMALLKVLLTNPPPIKPPLGDPLKKLSYRIQHAFLH